MKQGLLGLVPFLHKPSCSLVTTTLSAVFFSVSSPLLVLQGFQITHTNSKAEEVEEPHFSAHLTLHKTPSLWLQHDSWESTPLAPGKAAPMICKVSMNEQLGVSRISGKKPNRQRLCKPHSGHFLLLEECTIP